MAESSVMSAIEDFTAQTDGIIGVAAKHLETGERVSHNAEAVFFTASTLKVPLLVELYRQVDAGIIDVNQHIDLDRCFTGAWVRRPQGAFIWASADGSRLGDAYDYHQR